MVIQATMHTGRLLNDDANTTVPECMNMPGRCVYFNKTAFSYAMDEPIATEDGDTLRTTLPTGLDRSTFAWDGPQRGTYCIYISSRGWGGTLPHNHQKWFNVLTEGRKHWVLVEPFVYVKVSQTKEFELQEETSLHHKKNVDGVVPPLRQDRLPPPRHLQLHPPPAHCLKGQAVLPGVQRQRRDECERRLWYSRVLLQHQGLLPPTFL